MEITLDLIIGIVGMIFILTGFILDEFFKKYNQDTKIYNAINIIGSGMLIYYAFSLSSIPFIILNLVWFTVAIWKFRELVRKH